MHCVVPEGGLSLDGSRWVQPRYPFFLPSKRWRKLFRGKFLDALRGKLSPPASCVFPGQLKNVSTPQTFAALLRQCCRHPWVVYAKRPWGGPEHVLQYLGNYTHRIAISNHRLVAMTGERVSFRWRDSAHGNKKRVMALRIEEFLRRFFLPRASPGLRAHPADILASSPIDNASTGLRSAATFSTHSRHRSSTHLPKRN